MSSLNSDTDKRNKIILGQFENDLKEKNLSTKTIKSHMDNLDFFCIYLSYYEPRALDEIDASDVSNFLSDFFPRKAMWASPAHVKSYISTFKKFFMFSLAPNCITLDEYSWLLTLIKADKEMWIEAVGE